MRRSITLSALGTCGSLALAVAPGAATPALASDYCPDGGYGAVANTPTGTSTSITATGHFWCEGPYSTNATTSLQFYKNNSWTNAKQVSGSSTGEFWQNAVNACGGGTTTYLWRTAVIATNNGVTIGSVSSTISRTC